MLVRGKGWEGWRKEEETKNNKRKHPTVRRRAELAGSEDRRGWVDIAGRAWGGHILLKNWVKIVTDALRSDKGQPLYLGPRKTTG